MRIHRSLIFFLALALCAGCTVKPAPTEPTRLPTLVPTPEPSVTPSPAWTLVKTIHFKSSFMYGGFEDASTGQVLGTIGSGHNGVFYTTLDGGTTWTRGENSSGFLFGLDIVSAQVAWGCGEAASIRKTIDGGKTWLAAGDFGDREPNQCRFLSFLDATTGWAATPTRLALTQDGGDTWQEQTLPAEAGTLAAISLVSATQGYLLDAKGGLFVTTDGGSTWTIQPLEFSQNAFLGKMPSPVAAMRFNEAGTGMIVLLRGGAGSGYKLWSAFTGNAGQTWKMDELPLEPGLQNVYLSQDGRLLTVINTGLQELTLMQFQAN